MSSLSPFFRPLLPQWSFLVILNSNPKISLKPCVFSSSSSSNNDSVPLPKQSQVLSSSFSSTGLLFLVFFPFCFLMLLFCFCGWQRQLGYDPSEELIGLSPVPKPRFLALLPALMLSVYMHCFFWFALRILI